MTKLSDVFNLIQILGSIQGTKILCVGDLMLDEFVYGRVDRISPEAPIPVMQYQSNDAMLGGAGNVLRNLDALQTESVLVSIVGADDAAVKIGKLAEKLNSGKIISVTDSTRPTTTKTRYVSGNQQMLRIDCESKQVAGDVVLDGLWQKIKPVIPTVNAIILSDYAKGVLHPKLIGQIIAAARSAKIPVLADPKGSDYARYRGATVLCPNLKELAQGSGKPVESESDIASAAAAMIEKLELDAILVTRSKDGMSLFFRGGETHHLPALAREVYDVSGAGDTSIAMLASAIGAGASLLDAAHLANTAAGIVVAKMGTAVAMPSEIDEALLAQQGRSHSKLFETSPLLDRVRVWRHQGHKIGFTNGCFDLIHPGHISLLRQSRAACDRLIVAINTDESVKKLKGPSRPVQNQNSRATVLSSLDNVDAVVLFGEDTPMNLIHAIRPDVLVKGADYTVETVVGADFVQSYGGKILLAKLEEGHSTTGTVKKIAAV